MESGMLPNLRPSILHRQRKAAGVCTVENGEREYQTDQAYWHRRRSLRAQTEERLRKSLYERPEEYQQEVHAVEVLRAGEKLAKKQKAEEEEMRWQQAQMHTHEPTSLQVERPWTISALSIPAYVAERARRAQQHNDTEANRRAAAEKALTERMHREEDRRAVNKEISGEEGFFNFGAASEKWIAPERRVKHIHTPAVHRSSVFPAVPQTPSAQGTPRSAFLASAPATPVRTPVSCESKPASGMQHPWAWDAEPMHSKGRR